IAPDPAISILPPKITFGTVRISNLEGASVKDFFTVSNVEVPLKAGSLFTFSPKPSEIILDGAVIDFEALPGGRKNWQFTGKQQDGAAFHAYFSQVPLRLRNSVLRYSNSNTGATTQINGLDGVLAYEDDGKHLTYNGDVALASGDAKLSARMQAIDLTQETTPDVPLEFTIEQSATKVVAKGTLAAASREPEFVGDIEFALPGISHVISYFALAAETAVQPAPDDNGKFEAKGKINIGITRVQLTDLNVLATGGDAIPVLKGVADVEYQFGKQPVLNFSPSFESVDFDYLRKTYVSMLPQSLITPGAEAKKEDTSAYGNDDEPSNEKKGMTWRQFIGVVNANLNLKADNLIYNGRSIKAIEVQMEASKGIYRLNLGRANLPGETWLVFSGIGQNTERGLVYDGKMEMQGRKMEEFIALFAPRDVSVPPVELGLFGFRSNLAGTPDQFRLSEMQGRVSETRLAGALIFHLGDRLRLESFLRVAGMNMDTVKKAFNYLSPKDERVEQVASSVGGERLFDAEYINNQFRWLSAVPLDINADLLLENFVLFDRKGDRAQVTLDVGLGEISLKNVNARYNNADITGNYALKVEAGQNPLITISGTVSELNLADLFPGIARVQNEEEWQKFLDDPIDLMLFQTWRASINANVAKLYVRNYEFEDVDMTATLDKNTLSIEKLRGKLWNGNVQLLSTAKAGTIPALSMSFVMDNANLVRLSQMTALVKHAAGQMSIRGQLTTSGVSLRSWFHNATGAVSVVGQEISIQGFGLATLARAVPVARAVADLVKAKRGALEGGVARLASLEGQLTIANGLLDVTRAVYTSEEANGTVAGKIDLINESIDLATQFYLHSTAVGGTTPPKMTLFLKGPIDSVQKDIEMQEVEGYVARKSAERTLQVP
ncbi:MAG: hypothetical protein FJX23_07540, partial [Alphaproteobacteria bacterium]|nr:hypothetical protein [Alphaproteobacteria bacterium]